MEAPIRDRPQCAPTEHFLRRRLGATEAIRTLTGLQNNILTHLKEAATLGAELDRNLVTPAYLRLAAGPKGEGLAPKSAKPLPAPEIVAGAAEGGSEAA